MLGEVRQVLAWRGEAMAADGSTEGQPSLLSSIEGRRGAVMPARVGNGSAR
jgi:hypothetical protein